MNKQVKANADLNMDQVLDFLGQQVLDPVYTDEIGARFNDILLLVVTKSFTCDVDNAILHQKRCIALSKLLKYSPEIHK